jgi:2-phosphoglycolate phosphatase
MTDALRPFRAILFDFDGTLVDSFAAIAASVNHVRAQHGQPPLSVADVKKHVGHGAEYLLEHTVPGTQLVEDLRHYRAHHPTVMYDLTQWLPGAQELLQALRRAGKKIGLCSKKPRFFSHKLVQSLGVADDFDVVLGPEDVAAPKPAPDMVLRALERLDVPKEQALYVGDMTVDIQTARGAGVCVWVVPTGTHERSVLLDARPDRLLTNLHEMVAELA